MLSVWCAGLPAPPAGFFFGRTPLIKLSPKKTWEGFIGGFIGTVVVAALLADILSRFKWMTCPRPVSAARHTLATAASQLAQLPVAVMHAHASRFKLLVAWQCLSP